MFFKQPCTVTYHFCILALLVIEMLCEMFFLNSPHLESLALWEYKKDVLIHHALMQSSTIVRHCSLISYVAAVARLLSCQASTNDWTERSLLFLMGSTQVRSVMVEAVYSMISIFLWNWDVIVMVKVCIALSVGFLFIFLFSRFLFSSDAHFSYLNHQFLP